MRLKVSRKRRAFAAAHKFFDKDTEILEYLPCNDPNFSLTRMETNAGVQVRALRQSNAIRLFLIYKISPLRRHGALTVRVCD
jgi:hypothetical protein